MNRQVGRDRQQTLAMTKRAPAARSADTASSPPLPMASINPSRQAAVGPTDLAAGACDCPGGPASVSLWSPLLIHRNTLAASSTTRKAAGSHLR